MRPRPWQRGNGMTPPQRLSSWAWWLMLLPWISSAMLMIPLVIAPDPEVWSAWSKSLGVSEDSYLAAMWMPILIGFGGACVLSVAAFVRALLYRPRERFLRSLRRLSPCVLTGFFLLLGAA